MRLVWQVRVVAAVAALGNLSSAVARPLDSTDWFGHAVGSFLA